MACDPNTLAALEPCLECLSASQLEEILVILLASNAGLPLPGNLTTLLEDSACWNCASAKAKLVGITAKLHTLIESRSSLGDLVEMGKCLKCLQRGQIHSMLIYLLCLYIESLEIPA